MVYSTLADYSKKMAHWAVDTTFPSSPAIATASALVGWFSHRCIESYAPNYLNSLTIDNFGYLGYLIIPFTTPSFTPNIAHCVRFGAACTTSIVLNRISKTYFQAPTEPMADQTLLSLTGSMSTSTSERQRFAPYLPSLIAFPTLPSREYAYPKYNGEAAIAAPKIYPEIKIEPLFPLSWLAQKMEEPLELIQPTEELAITNSITEIETPSITEMETPVEINETQIIKPKLLLPALKPVKRLSLLKFILSLFDCMPKFPEPKQKNM